MYLNLLFDLVRDMSLIAMTAYLIGRNRLIINYVQQPTGLGCWLSLSAIFSLLSIIGTHNGIPIGGAFANTRIVGTLMSGFMGGPVVGLCTGVISGFHRYLQGGFTAETCAIATVLAGLYAGIIRQKYGLQHLTWKTGALVALTTEITQKALVLLFAKPFAAAWALEKIIAVPTTLVTILGTIVFILIIDNIKAEQDNYGAKAAELSLEIASQTLPYLRHGLTTESAQKTAEIIFKLTKVDSVSITDKQVVLAYIGAGADHHKIGETIMTLATKQVLQGGKPLIIGAQETKDCPVPNCPLQSGVIAPLLIHGTPIGTIKLSKKQLVDVSELDLRIVDGVANLLSVQIQLAEIDCQRLMREKAELAALQAQINPHFLFNTINIIMSFCRTNPDQARNLLGHLATLMQRSFSEQREFVTIKEELEAVEAYLEIAKCRFGNRLTITTEIAASVLGIFIPLLSIQPLIENAVQHGLFPKISDCELNLTARKENKEVIITVSDNGVGIPSDRLARVRSAKAEGIGIRNINGRMASIYGSEYQLTIYSEKDRGTQVTLRIPMERRNCCAN